MEIYEAMSSLRAVRRLRPDPLPEDLLKRVLQAAAWAPTGGNVQPFRILLVRDREKMAAIAPLYAEEWAKYTERFREHTLEGDGTARMLKAGDYLANHFADTPALAVFCFNADKMAITDAGLDRPSVVGGGSVYTAVQNFMLACRVEGLGCVLTTLLCYRESEVKAILEVPDLWGTCAHIPLGYPVLKGHGPISRRPVEKLVFEDSWMNELSF